MVINLKRLQKSFIHAFRGLYYAVREEQNFRIIACCGIVVIVMAWYYQIDIWEFSLLLFMVVFLLVLELINTTFEKLVDIVHPKLHHFAGRIKDYMAAAVLIASIVTAGVVITILGPYVV